ncbi:MAG: metallopeptidase family protein [Candidatus Omnitrophica bacterium]|nr:metallopeptidase family protein [Candidatus Omnitrophota bacterium]
MDEKAFEALVVEAVEGLPDEFKKKLENIDIVIEDGKPGRLLGLYQGVPLSERTHYYGNVLPDKITIFRNNIKNICRTDGEIKEAVRRTVIHEIAHYFGLSDDHMKNSGTY